MKAKVIEIKRFAVHDGDGIRTTVFLKGCPLKCVWCHNPESIDFHSQLAFYKNKCVSCGLCVPACPVEAHAIVDGQHLFDRTRCITCGKCENACLNGALALQGKEMMADEIVPILLQDKDFYDASNGGVTLSGGECLMNADFCVELLRKLKQQGIHTAVDTCGFVSREVLDKVIPYTDVFLYDLKAWDEKVHIRCTGRSNTVILDNLKYLDQCGSTVEVRIPFVPGWNDGEIEGIGDFLEECSCITKVRVLPYHNYAHSKYKALGMKDTLPSCVPNDAQITAAKERLANILKNKRISVV